MFEAETEDMLPRAAPKPSVSASEVPTAKPIVPDVSILFGRELPTNSTTPTIAQQQMPEKTPAMPSFAMWKKKVLPKVVYPSSSELTTSSSGATTCSVNAVNYMSTAGSNVHFSNPLITSTYPTTYTSSIDPLHYRRSLESAPVFMPTMKDYNYTATTPNPNLRCMYQTQCRSLDEIPTRLHTPPVHINAVETLTLCASTQTDNSMTPSTIISNMNELVENFPSKKDFEKLMVQMEKIYEEQQRLRQICETVLLQQQRTEKERPCVKHTATQCDHVEYNNVIYNYNDNNNNADSDDEENRPPLHQQQQPTTMTTNTNQVQHYYNNLHYQSPRLPPAAQSTAYRSESPRLQRPLLELQLNQHQKATTDKSRVMNELALKYLPNDQLNEMLQDLQITPTVQQEYAVLPQSVQRCKENFEKSPADISNASYKYLKKYRLLPEEDAAGVNVGDAGYQQPPQLRFNLEQRANSPRTITTAAAAAARMQQPPQSPTLDLEHIRQQPKLM